MRLADVNPLPGMFTIGPPDRGHEVGLRVGVTILVPLLLLLALDRMDLAIYATFAAFTGICGRNEPHGVRLRTPLTWPPSDRPDRGRRRLILLEAMWYVIAAGVAGSVAALVAAPQGVRHNYWTMVAAVVPLVGHSTRYRVNRGLQRVLGTALGLGLTALIVLLDPPAVGIVLVIAVLQVLAEVYIARQYVIAQTVVTPLALLSTMLVAVTAGGAAGGAPSLPRTRAGDAPSVSRTKARGGGQSRAAWAASRFASWRRVPSSRWIRESRSWSVRV